MPELWVNYACIEMFRDSKERDTISVTNSLVNAARAGNYLAKIWGITNSGFLEHWRD